MTFDPAKIKAVVFDYGNTLVEFNRPQVTRCDNALAEAVRALYGPHDPERLRAIRDRNRMAPYSGDPPEYRENDIRVISRDLVRELYDVEPTPVDLDALVQARFNEFVNVIEASESIGLLLSRLHRRYAFGLLSNYPDGSAIRASLKKVGLDVLFDAIVVSGDLGFAKPHPLPFETIVRDLGVAHSEVLHVGDNWLADVQGAKRCGMSVAYVRQWAPAESFERAPGDFEPDLTIMSVAEIENYV